MEDNKFENMTSKEQKEKLESIMEQIKLLHKQDVISASYEIVDVSYNTLPDGQVVYDITLTDPVNRGNFVHEFYKEGDDHTLSKFELLSDEDLKKYELAGFDTTGIQNERDEIQSLPNNPNKISLDKLKEQEKELEGIAKGIGISKDDIAIYSKFDANANLGLDANKISGIRSQEIEGNHSVTTNYTMNDILKMNCKSYVIVKDLTGSPSVYGISQDGILVKVDETLVAPANAASMSLMKSNGDMRNVGVVAAFRINNQGFDQSVGLYNDNGRIGGFYARGYLTADKMIGSEIPCSTYDNYTNRTRDILDPLHNQDISSEANSVAARLENNNASIENVKDGGNTIAEQPDIEDLADRIVERNPQISKDDLMNLFYQKAYKDNKGKNDYELLEEAAAELIEKERDEDKDTDKDDDVPSSPFSPWSTTPRPRM